MSPGVVHDERVGKERGKLLAVRHVELHAATRNAGVFLERRGEPGGAEGHAGDLLFREVAGQRPGVDPGRPHQLERPGGAAALGEVRAFDQAPARVHERGVHRRHVRRRQDPGQPRVFERHLAPPAPHLDHLQVDRDTALVLEHEGELSGSHSVPHGQGMPADEGLPARLQHVAVQVVSPEGIGAIEDDHGAAVGGAGLHGMQHRIDEGVITGPHVLHVVDEGIDVGQHLGAGSQPFSIEAVHPQPGGGVPAVLHVDEVLGVGPDAVLGPEQGGELEGARVVQGQHAVHQVGGDRGRVRDEAEAAALEIPRPCEELVEPGADAHSTCRRVKRPVAAAPSAA